MTAYLKAECHLRCTFSNLFQGQVCQPKLVLDWTSIILLRQIRHNHASFIRLACHHLVIIEKFSKFRVATDFKRLLGHHEVLVNRRRINTMYFMLFFDWLVRQTELFNDLLFLFVHSWTLVSRSLVLKLLLPLTLLVDFI